MKHTKPFNEYLNEAKDIQYPQEVQEILKNLVDTLPLKKYQLSAFNNYGVWFIELPFTSISISNLKRIEKIIPHFTLQVFGGSTLSIRTNIAI